jgi:hypothetical protein
MENVVYILGAGFSAPLGLPVMSNFLEKAKDAYFSNKEKYSYFTDVFDEIKKMSIIKNYFNADLFNIEEILSILEMNNSLAENETKNRFVDFLCDVIEFYSPKISFVNKHALQAHDWYSNLFLKKDKGYAFYISALLNLTYKNKFVCNSDGSREREIYCYHNKESNNKYSVITFNYDLTIENYMKSINEYYYLKNFDTSIIINYGFNLEKLHGCIKKKNIVAPTWNKNLNNDILPSWKNAHNLISKANHIRIIGYSLPETDTYIKYILKSAIVENEHLKSIDVLCYDIKSEVEERYTKFIKYPKFRFSNKTTEEYLVFHLNLYGKPPHYTDISQEIEYKIEKLEEAHNKFFQTFCNE